MGLRIPDLPDDFGIGADCLGCYAPDSTPTHVMAVCWDVVPCPGRPPVPNGQTFILEQLEVSPCEYEGTLKYEGNTWRAYYHMYANFAGGKAAELSFNNRTPPQVAAFFGRTDACGTEFPVNLHTCPFPPDPGGSASVIIFTDFIAWVLTHHYHFVTIPGVFYEKDDVSMDHAVYRIAHTDDHTNILILLDKEEIVYE